MVTLAARQMLKYLSKSFTVCSLSAFRKADTTAGLACDAGNFPTVQRTKFKYIQSISAKGGKKWKS